MSNAQGLRPLYLVNDLAKAADQEVTYAYDDLAFISHSEIIVQFADGPEPNLRFFIHEDLAPEAFAALKTKYLTLAQEQGTTLHYCGRFTMSPKEGSDEIDLQFLPAEV